MTLYVGDCLEILPTLDAESVDAVVTDPPAGINFMGQAFDSDRGGRDQWVAWLTAVLRECYRVAKPGAHAMIWALPRTSGWTHRAIEDAGWEIRDCITHLFGSGFPKSLDVSKAIDRAAGAEREVVERLNPHSPRTAMARSTSYSGFDQDGPGIGISVTTPATDEAKRWQGWGTALKPGAEFWYLARKPLRGTVEQNVRAYGVGALNIDGCRLATDDSTARHTLHTMRGGNYENHAPSERIESGGNGLGRWPSNVVLSHAEGCEPVGTRRVRNPSGNVTGNEPSSWTGAIYGKSGSRKPFAAHGNPEGTETVSAWACAPGCSVAELDAMSGERPSGGMGTDGLGHRAGLRGNVIERRVHVPRGPDLGGASRFYYCAKSSRAERDAGLDGERNDHPTVKPIVLMRWLCRLVTPPGGLILDPFAGSGSTGCAAVLEGFRFLGIEQDTEHADKARRRIAYWAEQRQVGLSGEVLPVGRAGKAHKRPADTGQLSLFAAEDQKPDGGSVEDRIASYQANTTRPGVSQETRNVSFCPKCGCGLSMAALSADDNRRKCGAADCGHVWEA